MSTKPSYLEAAEALAIGQSLVQRFGDLNIPDEQVLTPFIEKQPCIVKAITVAAPQVAEAIIRLGDAIGRSHLLMLEERTLPMLRKVEMDTCRQLLLESVAQMNALNERHSSAFENLEYEADQNERFRHAFEIQKAEIAEREAALDIASKQCTKAVAAYVRMISKATLRTTDLGCELVNAIRLDLRIPGNFEPAANLLSKSNSELFQETIATIDRRIEIAQE